MQVQRLNEIFATHYESSTNKIKEMREERIQVQNQEDKRLLQKLEDQIEEVNHKIFRKKEENEVLEEVIKFELNILGL